MNLSPADKAAGRRFRDRCAAALERSFVDDPPTYVVPVVIALFRHACPRRNNKSTALALREVYQLSPAEPDTDVCAGLFAFIHREGRCRFCGQTARSRAFRLVLAGERPPLPGHIARSEHRHG